MRPGWSAEPEPLDCWDKRNAVCAARNHRVQTGGHCEKGNHRAAPWAWLRGAEAVRLSMGAYRVDAPETPDGRRRQIRRGDFPTKTAAAEALRELQQRMAKGEEVGGSVTVAAFLEEWIAAKSAADRRASTLAQYRIYVDKYLKPCLGHVKFAELRATHIDKLLAKMESEGRGLPTRHRVMAALSSALSIGGTSSSRLGQRLPAGRIAPERTPTRPVYDVEQLSRFLASVSSQRLEALAALWRHRSAAGGGSRPLLVERRPRRQHAQNRAVSSGSWMGRLSFGPPKSDKGRRTIALDGETLRLLRTHRAARALGKAALGAGYVDDGLVFAHEDGSPLRPEW